MNNLKDKIKELASKQLETKLQRKTVKFEGVRTLQPYQAYSLHKATRETLRDLYMAYGLLRGKKQEEIESNPKTPINMQVVNALVELYTIQPTDTCPSV